MRSAGILPANPGAAKMAALPIRNCSADDRRWPTLAYPNFIIADDVQYSANGGGDVAEKEGEKNGTDLCKKSLRFS